MVLISLSISPLFSASSGNTISPVKYDYDKYEENEFPTWAMELRRGETIFFGSFVITLPVAMLCYSVASSLGAALPSDAGQAILLQAGGAAVLSSAIALTDWFLGKLEK